MTGYVLKKVRKFIEDDQGRGDKKFWPIDLNNFHHLDELDRGASRSYDNETKRFEEILEKIHKLQQRSDKKGANQEIGEILKEEIDQLHKRCSFYKALAFFLAYQFRREQIIASSYRGCK